MDTSFNADWIEEEREKEFETPLSAILELLT
jgi:hypothetical protein